MEEHIIKVKIADRVYPQKVSEDKEAAIRKAARKVDDIISEYSRKYRDVSPLDIATVVALNAAIESEKLSEKLQQMEKELAQLSADLQKYVDSLK